MRTNSVKALFEADKPAIGTWVTLCPHPRVIKIFAAAGFDFVIIEMEHTDFTMREVGVLTMVAREAGLTPIVRPPGTEKPHDLTRPLDAGAQGLLLPNIETAEQMEAIVRATKYHPRGSRIMNLKGPHTDYAPGDPAETIAHLNAHTILVAMIETQNGLDNLEAICGVDGVDAIMLGPDDLSQDLGVPGQLRHEKMLSAMEQLVSTCRPLGMPCGFSAQTPEFAQEWIAKGIRWVPFQNDAAMVFNTSHAAVPRLMEIAGRMG